MLDVQRVDAAHALLSAAEADRCAGHARLLRGVLLLAAAQPVHPHGSVRALAQEAALAVEVALVLGCAERRAQELLAQARVLDPLPGAVEAVACGLLSPETAAVVVAQLDPLQPGLRHRLWERVRTRLADDDAHHRVRPPADWRRLLRRWVVQADPEGAQERRRRAVEGRRVEYRRRDDGLADLEVLGLPGPVAQACLQRIRDRAARPSGPWDDRTADQRRADAVVDLLLGRGGCGDDCCASGPDGWAARRRGGCTCAEGASAPCGVQVQVLMTLGAGLGVTEEPAELVGHGPLDPEVLQQLLRQVPALRPVWVDDTGVPVAVGDQVEVVRGRTAPDVRRALLRLAAHAPPLAHARHPDDHAAGAAGGRAARSPAGPAPRPVHGRAQGPTQVPPAAPGGGSARALARAVAPRPDGGPGGAAPHPPGTPGAYRAPRRLRRLVEARSPLCEWPGCGVRAVHCDFEHDRPWPDGPTCACNGGPCCRRHHRVKQLGWTKTRSQRGLTWTSPAGRAWQSPYPHDGSLARVRGPLPRPVERLAPPEVDALLEELLDLGLLPDDPERRELRVHEPTGPGDADLAHRDTTWSWDLDDPYPWQHGELLHSPG